MRKCAIMLTAAVCLSCASAAFALTGCVKAEKTVAAEVINGGFESGTLSGWQIESGDAFDDDCVSSTKTFTFSYDENGTEIDVNQTGNWYLCGKGFDGTRSWARTGSIRSNDFILPEDGTISLKLAGGALVTARGSNTLKSNEKLCYVGVYRASDGQMLARQTNEYFLEHTDSYVDANKYALGVYSTDNFCEYTISLSEYAGETVYLRVVDNDTSVYYGYISVDDIRIGSEAEAQPEGSYYVKNKNYVNEAPAVSQYEIKNCGFETGSLAGWTVVEGNAFSNDGVNPESVWWNENITYSRDGNYHYGFYRPEATGVMRSSEFVLGGSGYISWKLGGCKDNNLTYIRFMLKQDGADKEIARFSNFKFRDFQFPYVPNGLRLLNMVQYYADFSKLLGETMYVEVVDYNSSNDELGCITLDSVITYHETKPVWYDSESFVAEYWFDENENNPYAVANAGFEAGSLNGWELSGGANVSNEKNYWQSDPNFWYGYGSTVQAFLQEGKYFYISDEASTSVLRSRIFTLGGDGIISFKLGAAKNRECYVAICDANTNEELIKVYNDYFNDPLRAEVLLRRFVDANAYVGRQLYIKVVDNATSDFGFIVFDDVRTSLTSQEAAEIKASDTLWAQSYRNDVIVATSGTGAYAQAIVHSIRAYYIEGYVADRSIINGGFESGNLVGWTYSDGTGDGQVSGANAVVKANTFWGEGISYNQGGSYHFDGWQANPTESNGYTLRSTLFTLSGSGFISFKMGGKSAVVKVYKQDGTQIAQYGNTEFQDVNFPNIDQGCRLATMTTFVADLSGYIGQKLYIELCDDKTVEGGWNVAFFDDIVTYYETAPVIGERYDVVDVCSGGTYNLPWVAALNVY